MAVMMIGLCSPLFAQESHAVHYTKKSLKVAWHLAQIVAGSIVTFVVGHDLLAKYDLLDREKIADMQPGDYVLYGVLVPTAFISGLSGLNDELELTKHAKQLYKRIVNKKEYEKKNDKIIT